jgi:2'-5' RNA ligase
MRLFIAILVPDDIKQLALQAKKQLIRIKPDVKWVKYENYHITLKFLGEVNYTQLNKIKQKLEAVSQICAPIRLNSSSIGFFPARNRPRIIWLGFKGELEKAGILSGRLDTALSELGFAAETNRRFHLTLGRMRSLRNIEGFLTITDKINNDLESYDIKVNHF